MATERVVCAQTIIDLWRLRPPTRYTYLARAQTRERRLDPRRKPLLSLSPAANYFTSDFWAKVNNLHLPVSGRSFISWNTIAREWNNHDCFSSEFFIWRRKKKIYIYIPWENFPFFFFHNQRNSRRTFLHSVPHSPSCSSLSAFPATIVETFSRLLHVRYVNASPGPVLDVRGPASFFFFLSFRSFSLFLFYSTRLLLSSCQGRIRLNPSQMK